MKALNLSGRWMGKVILVIAMALLIFSSSGLGQREVPTKGEDQWTEHKKGDKMILPELRKEKFELLDWHPCEPSTGDLETATNNITVTAKPASPQYTGSWTMTASPDARLTATNFGFFLGIQIDRFGAGASQLNFSMEIEDRSGSYVERLTGNFTGAGWNTKSNDLTSAQIYAPGNAVGVKIYLWADHSDGVVVSRVQAWLGVGTSQATHIKVVMRLVHTGLITVGCRCGQMETSNAIGYIHQRGYSQPHDSHNPCLKRVIPGNGGVFWLSEPLLMAEEGLDFSLMVVTGGGTGIINLDRLNVVLRSE